MYMKGDVFLSGGVETASSRRRHVACVFEGFDKHR